MIAVHCGAGTYSEHNYIPYKKLSKKACRAAIKVLKADGSALEAIKAAMIVLENDPLTNAGYGSNLTRAGYVECDAAVMDGRTLLYGGCGAVRNVKNPIEIAHKLCVQQLNEQPLGLIAPSLLVADGAFEFAKANELTIVSEPELSSLKAQRQFMKYKSMLDMNNMICTRMDTVGAVCIDKSNNVVSACSSGGLLLKYPGRVGQSALYASGVWAENCETSLMDNNTVTQDVQNLLPDVAKSALNLVTSKRDASVAVCTSGCGEYLVRTLMAKQIADDLKTCRCPTTTLSETMTDKFINSKYLENIKMKNCGALVLHMTSFNEGTILWGHSTATMGIGYMNINDERPKSIISMLPNDIQPGTRIIVGGTNF